MDDTIVKDEDIYWKMDWTRSKAQGFAKDKPDIENVFEPEKAMARLLAEEVIFLNSHWYEKDWPEQAQKTISVNVNCNDIFAWACSDAEELKYNQIQPLYDAWVRHNFWGVVKWCAIRRNQKPQPPVIRDMKTAGFWDEEMEALPNNWQDAETQALFASLKNKQMDS